MKKVLIPKENVKDLAEIPENVKRGLEIVPCESVDDVLAHALVDKLTAIEWLESEEVEPVSTGAGEDDRGGLITH